MILPPHTPCAELAADRLRREMEAQRTELRVMLALPRYRHMRARLVRDVMALEKALGECRS